MQKIKFNCHKLRTCFIIFIFHLTECVLWQTYWLFSFRLEMCTTTGFQKTRPPMVKACIKTTLIKMLPNSTEIFYFSVWVTFCNIHTKKREFSIIKKWNISKEGCIVETNFPTIFGATCNEGLQIISFSTYIYIYLHIYFSYSFYVWLEQSSWPSVKCYCIPNLRAIIYKKLCTLHRA